MVISGVMKLIGSGMEFFLSVEHLFFRFYGFHYCLC